MAGKTTIKVAHIVYGALKISDILGPIILIMSIYGRKFSTVFTFIYIAPSTIVEQAVACAPVTQWARVRSPVGTSFLGEVFFGVFPHL